MRRLLYVLGNFKAPLMIFCDKCMVIILLFQRLRSWQYLQRYNIFFYKIKPGPKLLKGGLFRANLSFITCKVQFSVLQISLYKKSRRFVVFLPFAFIILVMIIIIWFQIDIGIHDDGTLSCYVESLVPFTAQWYKGNRRLQKQVSSL